MASDPVLTTIAQDETLTGEAVALDVQSTGFFLRALGVLIDMVASLLVLLLLIAVATWMLGAGVLAPELLAPLSITLIVLVTVVVPTTVETATRGRSLGRLVIGGRIVRADGGSIGFRHAFLRALAGVLELWFTFGALAAIVGVFTPRAQRLGDLLAGTYSERTRTAPLPAAASALPPGLEAWASVADVARLPDRLAARIARFVRSAGDMQPPARARLAAALAEEAGPFVAPRPPVDADTFVRAVAAVRASRELHSLQAEQDRVERLLPAENPLR
jgi:uncharacterized RDD family membrane protein YckC